MSTSSRASTPPSTYYKLPPIITTVADREFLNEVNDFIESELNKIDHFDQEQRYTVYKTVFNKVIEHVAAYKPVLTHIKKEYEDTIETIKKGQREAAFLQGKLKAMASEPSTLRNYKKRADELEERILIVKKDNEKLQSELSTIQQLKEEKEQKPKTAEKPERLLKKDKRLIPGLTIEEATNMTVLRKKYETLDRQIKELNLSLRARFLPKSHKLQLKDSLDKKVAYRDQLLWQSQVYKARGQKMKIALEAAQAYNQMKPPHQTVGDAVIIAFQQASGRLKAEKEKAEGEQNEASQSASFEDDDPNKEKEAEMMLEYIEKFNEHFEDGMFEEAAVHAANSPKGILRTQATLAKFRDVKVKSKGRSPLLAFCDAIMSSVRAAGSKPNEALSIDCIEAGLNENRLDLAYHWLAQDRLSQSYDMGKMISEHCSCQLPCKCGCQALAQSVFQKLKHHRDVVVTLLKQGKVQGALQCAQKYQCVTDETITEFLQVYCNKDFVQGLMGSDVADKKSLFNIHFGPLLFALKELNKPELTANLINVMLSSHKDKPDRPTSESVSKMLSLKSAVMLDSSTTSEQWLEIVQFLDSAGYQEISLQLLAMTTVVDILQQAWKTAQEDIKSVSFSNEVIVQEPDEEGYVEENHDPQGYASSSGMSSVARESTSMDRSSREASPDVKQKKKSTEKKKRVVKIEDNPSSSECSTPQISQKTRKKALKSEKQRQAVTVTHLEENSHAEETD